VNTNRTPIVAGNWKMNTTLAEARDLAGALVEPLSELTAVDTVLCPPFISLAAVRDVIAGSRVALGAQNCHFEAKGAFTGEIAPPMLAALGCRFVILGHSERRQYFGETDEGVARRVKAVLGQGLIPIVCVGEDLRQNEAGETERVVGTQVRGALDALSPDQVAGCVIAYEPIWAIGTGRAATPEGANDTIAIIRATVAEVSGEPVANALRIQYGGSVTADNFAAFIGQPDIDGALVGGASLRADQFVEIVRLAAP
jgi:triosephosphate isomerase